MSPLFSVGDLGWQIEIIERNPRLRWSIRHLREGHYTAVVHDISNHLTRAEMNGHTPFHALRAAWLLWVERDERNPGG